MYIEPEELPLGTGTVDILFDIPAGIQGWAYAVCIPDCDRAHFVRVERDPGIAAIVDDTFEVLELEDCLIRRGAVLDLMLPIVFGPEEGMRDISVVLESWAPTEACLCVSPDTPPTQPVFVQAGATIGIEPPFDCCQLGAGPLVDLACTPEPLSCGAWKVSLAWRRVDRVDAIGVFQDNESIAEISGAYTEGVLYGISEGPLELCLEPIVGGVAGDRLCCQADIPSSRTGFIRGDANQDGAIDIGDAAALLHYLFRSYCLFYPPAADANGDSVIDVADPIYLLVYLFAGGAPPPAPFPGCG
jgi:hypothetical protein